MTLYMERFSRFPRPVTAAHARAGLTRQLGQAPTTRDIINSYPMPVTPAYQWDPSFLTQQTPGPFLGRDLPQHLYKPRNGENLDLEKTVPLGALDTTVTIIDYRVPIGRNGIINKVANGFIGGGWIAGTGDVVWRILIDGGPVPGATTYHFIDDSLGATAQPVGIAGFPIFENQRLTVVALNNSAGSSGGIIVAGQRVSARLMGHLYPRDMEYHDLWV